MTAASSVCSTPKVSGEIGTTQSSVGHHLHDLGRNMQSCQIMPYVANILQNFWLNLVMKSLTL